MKGEPARGCLLSPIIPYPHAHFNPNLEATPMKKEELKTAYRLGQELEEANRRKAHYKDRLTELMAPRPNEAARKAFIDRIAEDLSTVMYEIKVLKEKYEKAGGTWL